MENAEHAQTTHVVTVKVQACQRMARSYINSGSLAAADACVSTGLELASNDWMLLRLQDEVGFRSAMANESCRNLPSPTVACWAPALGMQLGPMEQQHGITRCSGRSGKEIGSLTSLEGTHSPTRMVSACQLTPNTTGA